VHRPHCVVGALGDSILKVEVDGLHAGKAESMLRAAISIRGAADCEPLSSLFQLRIYRLELGDVDASVIIFGELLELLGEELSQLERRAGMVVRSVTCNGGSRSWRGIVETELEQQQGGKRAFTRTATCVSPWQKGLRALAWKPEQRQPPWSQSWASFGDRRGRQGNLASAEY
jgi:hypothetical protein